MLGQCILTASVNRDAGRNAGGNSLLKSLKTNGQPAKRALFKFREQSHIKKICDLEGFWKTVNALSDVTPYC